MCFEVGAASGRAVYAAEACACVEVLCVAADDAACVRAWGARVVRSATGAAGRQRSDEGEMS